MWNKLESYKHQFLQMELEHLKPISISPLVQREFKKTQLRHAKKCQFPVEGSTPCEESTFLDDHAQLAYGLRTLPKLIRELCSDDLKTQWRAINSLSEFLLNPINAQRAIEMDVVRILKNAFLRHRFRFLSQKYREVERLLECFRQLSIYNNGAREIAKRKILCDEFYRIILELNKNSELAASILRNLSEKPDVLLQLKNNCGSYEHLQEIFFADTCYPKYPYNLWMHLSHFLEIDPDRGVELGFFQFLHSRIVKKYPEYYGLTMKCFALILRCESGQRCFDEVDGIVLLYCILSNDFEPLPTYEYVIMAFLHGLQSKHAMRRCTDFVNLPKIMTKFALKRNHLNPRLQLYALKTLRQLGEMPCIKDYMRCNCKKNIENILCLNEENDCQRVDLILWLDQAIFATENAI